MFRPNFNYVCQDGIIYISTGSCSRILKYLELLRFVQEEEKKDSIVNWRKVYGIEEDSITSTLIYDGVILIIFKDEEKS